MTETPRQPLTPKQEARRRRGLKTANGVGSWFGYKLFRGAVVLASKLMMQGQLWNAERLPQPSPDYYPPFYMHYRNERVSKHAFVVAPNHSHMLDIALTGFIRRPMAWPSKPAFVKWRILKLINQRVGCVPFMRDTDWEKHPEYAEITYTKDELKAVMNTALLRGQPVVLYPQGTRRDDANFEDAKLGAVYAAIRANVPLVPLAIYGVGKADEHFKTRFLKRYRAIAVVMDPIYPHEYWRLGGERDVAPAMFEAWQRAIEQGRQQACTHLRYYSLYR